MVHWTTALLPLLGSAFFSNAVATEVSAPVVAGAYIVELADNHVSLSRATLNHVSLIAAGLCFLLQHPGRIRSGCQASHEA